MTLDVLMVASGHLGIGTVKLLAISVPVIVTLARGVFMIGARSHRDNDGEADGAYLVVEADQPELWAAVRRIAAAVGTRAPDEIRLIPEGNAGVAEKTRMLGLIPGRRLMMIGTPLVAGLSEAELDAVLAHELGHYANRDTRLAGITYRGRTAIGHTLGQIAGSHGIDSFLARIFRSYAKLYLRVSQEVCRRQEYAADAASVRVAGAAATVSALRRIAPLSTAWQFFQSRYVYSGVGQGFLPADVMGGFVSFLAEPSRQAEMREVAEETRPAKASPYDSHPPLAERVAAIMNKTSDMPAEGAIPGRPARALLADPERVLQDSFDSALNDRGRALNRLPWEEFVHRTVRDSTALSVGPLFAAAAAVSPDGPGREGRGRLGTVLAVLETGGAALIGARLPGDPVKGDSQRVRDELYRSRTRTALGLAVDLALADTGKARWVLSWSSPTHLVYAPGITAEQLTAALDAIVSRQPDAEPLRKILAEAGVPDTYEL
ncbi:M48 family metallopeptidase [Catenulispora subtropica]|uniref:M48 family metallopeptidase n=1 Tax=Catenulispora subtropica TaxID=450798 RepID=A0ABP5EN99_9ACTN